MRIQTLGGPSPAMARMIGEIGSGLERDLNEAVRLLRQERADGAPTDYQLKRDAFLDRFDEDRMP